MKMKFVKNDRVSAKEKQKEKSSAGMKKSFKMKGYQKRIMLKVMIEFPWVYKKYMDSC